MRHSILFALLALSATAFAVEGVEDTCSDCHDAPVVPEVHPPVTEMSTDACGTCHGARQGDPYFAAVHGTHLDLGVGCEYCHAEAVPSFDRLRELTSN